MSRTSVPFFAIGAFLLCTTAAAQSFGTCEPASAEAFLDVNNVRALIQNGGRLFLRNGQAFYEIPKGSGVNAIFSSGIWIAGIVNEELRVSATRGKPLEMWPGPLDDNGNPPVDCSEFDRLYKVSRTDILAYEEIGSLTADLADWPTGLGAPTYDKDGDLIELLDQPLFGRAERVIDLEAGERPAILGDQSIWWLMNDRGNEHKTTDSPPIGIEVHAMAYAFDENGDMDNTTFYKYNLYYKGSEPLQDGYFGVYVDMDLGDFEDDYLGSDSLLGLGYTYNADNVDDDGDRGYGTPPPAAGVDFLQGPIIPSPGETAVVSGVSVPDYANLQMTTFVDMWDDALNATFDTESYYARMKGLFNDGTRITEGDRGRGFSEVPTNFMYSGNEETQAFWTQINYDGLGSSHQTFDSRFVMSTGPFTMQPGDRQEIVIAIIWAKGADHLDSIRALREADTFVQDAFDAGLLWPARPVGIVNEQPHAPIQAGVVVENLYPNPTSGPVTFSLTVDVPSLVTVKVYSIIGRELLTVTNETLSPGSQVIAWSMLGLTPGTYFVAVTDGRTTQIIPLTLVR